MAVFIERGITWKRCPCAIDGDIISAIKGPVEEYDVMEYNGKGSKPALYAVFAAINENNLAEIKDFCCQFGLLGLSRNNLYREKEQQKTREAERALLQSISASPIIPIPAKSIGNWSDNYDFEAAMAAIKAEQNYRATHEAITDIQREIKTIRFILQGINAIRVCDKENARAIWRELILLDNSIEELEAAYFDNENPKDPFYLLGNITSIMINRQLAGVAPGLDPTYKTGSFVPEWRGSNLLAAIYLILYLELTQGHLFKQCENKTCQQWFPVSPNNINKKYCGNDCARAQAQREYRNRNKKK